VALNFMDKILPYIPTIKAPGKPLSLREKMYWTGIIITIYFLLYNTYATGVNPQAVTQPFLQLVSIVFAAKIGSVITIGIGPIVLASIVLQLLNGSGLINLDMNNPEDKARFQGVQKLSAMSIGLIESIIFVSTGYVPLASTSYFGIVVLQLFLGSLMIIYMDEMMTKYGITSGINLFIASGVSYAIVAGTVGILIPEATAAIQAGGAAAYPTR